MSEDYGLGVAFPMKEVYSTDKQGQFVPIKSYYWLSNTPQTDASHPLESTFGYSLYRGTHNEVRNWQKVMYTYELPSKGFNLQTPLLLMKLTSSGRLKETSFERVLTKLNQLQKYDNQYPNTLYPIELRGNNLNAGDLNPQLLFHSVSLQKPNSMQ